MTDEEARRIVKKALQVDADYGDMSVEITLVQAGCRAGLEEVMVELERLLDLPDEDRDSTMDVYELKRWLDDKLKEQP
jgi:hypothetical protein